MEQLKSIRKLIISLLFIKTIMILLNIIKYIIKSRSTYIIYSIVATFCLLKNRPKAQKYIKKATDTIFNKIVK